jgi:hypothetical protein
VKKFLLCIFLGVLLACSISAETDDDKTYKEFNKKYFGNLLPQDTTTDSELKDPAKIAETTKDLDGRFHISFNPDFAGAYRVRRMIMLHEQCHIREWDELSKTKNQHGRHWRACMLDIDHKGGFRTEWIDGYEGK